VQRPLDPALGGGGSHSIYSACSIIYEHDICTMVLYMPSFGGQDINFDAGKHGFRHLFRSLAKGESVDKIESHK
jgi:hypothetical protein